MSAAETSLVPVGRRDIGDAVALPNDKVELIKRTIARGATDDELSLFVSTANRLGLDPFAKQIYAIKRWNPQSRQEEMITVVGIDGMRATAEKSGNYLPGPRPAFKYNAKGEVVSAIAAVRKFLHGDWHVVEGAEVFFDEYCQWTGKGDERRLTSMWATKPHVMLGKCAEAQALRRAFPILAGVYAREELAVDGDVIDIEAEPEKITPPPSPPSKTTAPMPAATRTPAGAAPVARARTTTTTTTTTPTPRPAQNLLDEQAAREQRGKAETKEMPAAPPKPAPPRSALLEETDQYFDAPAPKAEPEAPPTAPAERPQDWQEGDALPAPPPPKETDAQGIGAPVDIVRAWLQMATTLAEVKVQEVEIGKLKPEDHEWVIPDYAAALIRVIAEGPEIDGDAALVKIGKLGSAKRIRIGQSTVDRAAAAYKARRAAP